MKHNQDCEEIGIQISKLSFVSGLVLISVYRSQHGNIGSLLKLLEDLMSEESAVLIMGDFNLCNKKKPNNAIKSFFEKNEFSCLIHESTQIMGGFIDHAYWKDSENLWKSPILERYSPYFSDHDALCVTLNKKEFEIV